MSDELRPIRKILLATGLTSEAIGAAQAAGQLAGLLDAELHVAHVVEPMSATEEAAIPGLAEKHVEQGNELLGEFVHDNGIDSSTLHVLRGDAESEILRKRAELKADLLVVGRYGRGGLKRGRLGSIAESIVRKCPVSTLIVQPESREKPKHIGVACDLFQDEHIELERAMQLGDAYGLETIDMLDVYRIPTGYHMVATLEECRSRIEKAARERADALLAHAKEHFGDKPRVELNLAEGEPAPQLAEMVGASGIDLLVIGTHWRTPMAQMLLGRTTERIIREVRCSVWADKSPERFQGLLEGLKGLLD